MTDLAAWLLEQVAEDERGARAAAAELQRTLPGLPARTVPNAWVAIEYDWEGISVWQQEAEGGYTPTGDGATSTTDHITRWDPARVLAECEAKRRIVAEVETGLKAARLSGTASGRLALDYTFERTLRLLALPYVDRPGYREEWRP